MASCTVMGMLAENRECRSCYGAKRDRHAPEPCHVCRGTGVRLTELGIEIIDLLSEHFILTPKPERDR